MLPERSQTAAKSAPQAWVRWSTMIAAQAGSTPPPSDRGCSRCGAALPSGDLAGWQNTPGGIECPKCVQGASTEDAAEDERQGRKQRAKARSQERRAAEGGEVLPFPTRFNSSGQPHEHPQTAEQIARHFQVSKSSVRRWQTEGMPSHLVGLRSRRYLLSEVVAWFEKRHVHR